MQQTEIPQPRLTRDGHPTSEVWSLRNLPRLKNLNGLQVRGYSGRVTSIYRRKAQDAAPLRTSGSGAFHLSPDPKLSGIEWTKPMSAANLARNSHSKHGRGTSKTAVFVAVERQGRIHRRVVTDVTAANLKKIMHEVIERRSRHMSDDFRLYWGVGKTFLTHETVNHSQGEYARGDVHTNTAESSFVLLKRGIHGIYHNVSRLHLQRYIWQADFLWNNRQLNDGERITRVIKSAEGKRVRYLPEQK